MTIASEISRLQCAKADIKTAIENKGVTVGSSLTIDDYAACINEIQQGGSAKVIKYTLLGGGAGGRSNDTTRGGGGGAGGFAFNKFGGIDLGDTSSLCVIVGCGGGSNQNGGDSYICGIDTIAKGGCTGNSDPSTGNYKGGCSGSGCCGGGSWECFSNYYTGGGGGACGNGSNCNGGLGWCGMAGGGGGFRSNGYGVGCCGGGNGGNGNDASGCRGCNATTCGSGGGGGIYSGGNGAGGLVDICYPSDGGGIKQATGGSCCFVCDGYCVHRFTSNGTFCVVC